MAPRLCSPFYYTPTAIFILVIPNRPHAIFCFQFDASKDPQRINKGKYVQFNYINEDHKLRGPFPGARLCGGKRDLVTPGLRPQATGHKSLLKATMFIFDTFWTSMTAQA